MLSRVGFFWSNLLLFLTQKPGWAEKVIQGVLVVSGVEWFSLQRGDDWIWKVSRDGALRTIRTGYVCCVKWKTVAQPGWWMCRGERVVWRRQASSGTSGGGRWLLASGLSEACLNICTVMTSSCFASWCNLVLWSLLPTEVTHFIENVEKIYGFFFPNFCLFPILPNYKMRIKCSAVVLLICCMFFKSWSKCCTTSSQLPCVWYL